MHRDVKRITQFIQLVAGQLNHCNLSQQTSTTIDKIMEQLGQDFVSRMSATLLQLSKGAQHKSVSEYLQNSAPKVSLLRYLWTEETKSLQFSHHLLPRLNSGTDDQTDEEDEDQTDDDN